MKSNPKSGTPRRRQSFPSTGDSGSGIQHPTPNTQHPTSTLAWQGLELRLPPDWNPLALTGKRDKGTARIGDLSQIRLLIIWQTAGFRDDAKRVWRRYVKQLELKNSEHGESLVHVSTLTKRLAKGGWKDPIVASVQTNNGKSLHALARAPFSRRFILARLPLTADVNRYVPDIFDSLQESQRESLERWCIYDFEMRVPQGSRMVASQLQPGHILMRFRKAFTTTCAN